MENTDLSKIIIRSLKAEEIDDFIAIEFSAFHEIVLSIYSNDEESAVYIRKSEIKLNLSNSTYFVAENEGKIIGTIEIFTKEALKNFKRNFSIYNEKLGYLKSIKAYFFSSISPYKMGDDTLYLDTVAVRSSFRRKGIARRLIQFAEDCARRYNKKYLSLWVAKDNKPAVGLYRNLGFDTIIKKFFILGNMMFKHSRWIYMKKEII